MKRKSFCPTKRESRKEKRKRLKWVIKSAVSNGVIKKKKGKAILKMFDKGYEVEIITTQNAMGRVMDLRIFKQETFEF